MEAMEDAALVTVAEKRLPRVPGRLWEWQDCVESFTVEGRSDCTAAYHSVLASHGNQIGRYDVMAQATRSHVLITGCA